MNLNNLMKQCYEITKSKGFDLSQNTIQQLLIGTEVQEALECIHIKKKGTSQLLLEIKKQFEKIMIELETLRKMITIKEDSSILDIENLEEELSDILIRVFSYAGYLRFVQNYDLDLDRGVRNKLEYNQKRDYLHGKKF